MYHSTKPASTLNASKLKRAEILKILTELEVMDDANITATEGKAQLRKWQKKNVDQEIIQLVMKSDIKWSLRRQISVICSRSNYYGQGLREELLSATLLKLV